MYFVKRLIESALEKMIYKIKAVNMYRLIAVAILMQLGTFGVISLIMLVGGWDKLPQPLVGLFIVGVVMMMIYFFFWNDREMIVQIEKEGVVINDKLIKWTELKSYKIKDDNPEFKTLILKTTQGGTFHIGHRKRYENKDDLEKFQNTFTRKIEQLNYQGITNITQTPLIWESKWGKLLGYALIVNLVVWGILLFTVDFDSKPLTYYFFLLAITAPLLTRIFIMKK